MIQRTAAVLAFIAAPAVFAQTYIVPEGDCGAVTLHVTRGDFPNLGETIAADQIADALVYLPKQKLAVKPAESARSLTFNADVPETGVVMAAVDLKPAVSGNETRTAHAKALLFCGATPPADWQRSTGLGLEIYPQGWNGPRPHLKQGDPMRFIAVDQAANKMLRDLPMQLYRAGAGHIADGVPAASGGMNFPYQEPGRYMVVATYRRPDPQQPEHWLVDTSTLTFEIK